MLLGVEKRRKEEDEEIDAKFTLKSEIGDRSKLSPHHQQKKMKERGWKKILKLKQLHLSIFFDRVFFNLF